MKLVGPAREHPSPPKLVEPAREHPSPPKLVEPDCDEGAVRVETTPSTASRPIGQTSVPWHRLERRKQAHRSETPCQNPCAIQRRINRPGIP